MQKVLWSGMVMTAVVLFGLSGCSGGDDATQPDPVVPTVTAYSGNVDENSVIGTTVGTLSIDNGGSSITSIVLDGDNNGDFSVATDGTITVSGVLDYETIPLYQLSVVATNSVGSSSPVDVNISVNDLTEATVPILSAFSGSVDENSVAGTVVGQISVDDGGSVVTAITLSGSGEGNFTVETNGTIVVASGAVLDYETQVGYTLQAVATNGIGTSNAVDVNISLNNLYEGLLKTGQVISYDAEGNVVNDGSLKDDGFYQKGIARSYSRANDIVTDNVTSLMWQDDAAGSDMNWTAAITQCEGLSLGSYTDWRLPSEPELLSITDMDGNDPAIDPEFQNTVSGFYWSSTTYEANPANAWGVGFDYGYGVDSDKNSTGYVRCVKSGQ